LAETFPFILKDYFSLQEIDLLEITRKVPNILKINGRDIDWVLVSREINKFYMGLASRKKKY
jgi:hypothetical protein